MTPQVKRSIGMTLITLAIWSGIIIVFQPILADGALYVAPGGDDNNDCQSPGNACATINGGLAKLGDTINIATGVYTDTGDQVVLIDRDVTLSGGWNEAFTTQNGYSIIDAEDRRRGVHVIFGVSVTVTRFIIQHGYSFSTGEPGGSGLLNFGQLIVNDSSIRNNFAWSGGNVFNYGTLTFNQSAVNRNSAEGTSGIFNEGYLTLNNSTVSGNRSGDSGGGIHISRGSLSLNSSTVADNFALFSGGGISQNKNNYTSVRLQNSIVAGNKSAILSSCSGELDSGGYNLIDETEGCDFIASEGDQLMIDISLEPLTGTVGYHPLSFGSPAIDAGNPTGCTTSWPIELLDVDQRGVPRARRCDIGAYEYDGPYLLTFLPIIFGN